MKILIVDDSLLDRKLLMNVLKKGDITNEILQAVDGEEGLKLLGAHHEDICLILLDWQMPKVNGIDFMKAVVKVPDLAKKPIVMITASGSDDSRQLAYETNPDLAAYVVKPYKKEYLINVVQSFVTAHG